MPVSPLDALWSPVTIGGFRLRNRIAMAPMTRDRSAPDGSPVPLNAEYYGQRGSVGLVITEGTQPSDDGQGYLLTPGVYTNAHVAGWRRVAEAVHKAGAPLVVQLMHVGRVSHPGNTPHGRQPVAPSAVAPANTKMFTVEGMKDIPEPRALSTEEVEQTVQDFAHAASRAVEAGADGVEIHGANGYLVQQFLASNANLRTDRYGGSVENRIRFAVEVCRACAEAIGADRVGLRISPGSPNNGIVEDDVEPLYTALVGALAPLGLAYLHPIYNAGHDGLFRQMREAWPGAYVLNRPGASAEERAVDVESGLADVVSLAQMTLANPDLVARLKRGAPLNEPDPSTYYGGDARGYTDYPTLPETRRGEAAGAPDFESRQAESRSD